MNINILFAIISTLLLMIFFLFKPLDIKQQEFVDVPLFNISSFTMHELDNNGLITLMIGSEATRYKDRYAVKNIDYTDNSKNYIANMNAKNGIYKDDTVTLYNDVVYIREDELTFKTKKVVYDKKTTIARSDGKYVLFRGNDEVRGSKLVYNNSLNTIQSRDVVVKYQLQERKK